MHISIISIFPEIFESFLTSSLIQKAREKQLITIDLVNPRDFCNDKHKQIDDEIYGGGAGMLLKAEPIIHAIQDTINKNNRKKEDIHILFPSPSKTVFNQQSAHSLADKKNLIFICGRYEGIDYRMEERLNKNYPKQRKKISLGQFITLGGETPTMVMIEAITRLLPGVINKAQSREDESYNILENMNNLEAPQYTRPQEFDNMKVPEVLLSGDHKKIEERKKEQSKDIS
ncbi:MAG: tRNA (guanosine(37)-N1)-methyltransferase TrmD [candidate division SR1 bacterium]|nr:MAG: tRNA (guanosine(37)-N1)-methyltransferase TrmD [candidate division SR1 bacterium]